MVRQLDHETQNAINSPQALVLRDFVWFQAKDRTTGAAREIGFWTDSGDVTANVIDPDTNSETSRLYIGDGAILEIGNIPLVIDLTIQNVSLTLSNIHPSVQTLVRTYNPRHAPVQIHRGFFDPRSYALKGPPRPQFIGIVNEIDVNSAEAGGEGEIVIDLASQTRELTRTFNARRSDTNQRLRNPSDTFRQYTGVAGTWEREIRWGEESGS